MSMESTLMVGIKQCFSSTSAVPFPAVSIALKGDVVDALSPLRTCEQNSDCPLEYTCTADVTPELTTGRGDDAGFPDLFDELIFGGSTDEVRRNKCVCVLSHEQVHFLVHATCSRCFDTVCCVEACQVVLCPDACLFTCAHAPDKVHQLCSHQMQQRQVLRLGQRLLCWQRGRPI